MSVFTDGELAYLGSQRLGRLATINAAGEPHVVPVVFRYNPELDTIDIGGHRMAQSKKFRDVARNERVAFVVDDVLPPWQARGVEVRGTAEALSSGGSEVNPDFDADLIRIRPRRIVGWGIDSDPYKPNSRSVESSPHPGYPRRPRVTADTRVAGCAVARAGSGRRCRRWAAVSLAGAQTRRCAGRPGAARRGSWARPGAWSAAASR